MASAAWVVASVVVASVVVASVVVASVAVASVAVAEASGVVAIHQRTKQPFFRLFHLPAQGRVCRVWSLSTR